MAAHILAILNQKGGTGKTTTTLNLGAAFAQVGKKVLLIDLDTQGGLTYSLGIREPRYELADWLSGKASFEETCLSAEGLDLIPAGLSLAKLEVFLAKKDDGEMFLPKKMEEAGLLEKYDFILFDGAPSLNILIVNALAAAQWVISPMQLEVLTAHGLKLMLDVIARANRSVNPELKLLGVLPVKIQTESELSDEVFEYLKNSFAIDFFENWIYFDDRIIESPSFGQSILKYRPDSPAAGAYRRAAREVLHFFGEG